MVFLHGGGCVIGTGSSGIQVIPPIAEVVADGIVVGVTHHKLDVLVCATGYDALSGAVLQIDIRGRAGRTLRAKWADGPRTYLGLMTAGFPNMFMITSAGSPSVLVTEEAGK